MAEGTVRGPLELPGHPLIDSPIRFYIGKAVRKPPEQLWLTHTHVLENRERPKWTGICEGSRASSPPAGTDSGWSSTERLNKLPHGLEETDERL